MLDYLKNFFLMGGYGWYIFTAYGTVSIFLLVQWLISFRQWKKISSDDLQS